MSDLKTRCLIAASGAFLTEFLTEELLSQDDEIIFQFIEDNKWEPVEDYSSEDIWNMIDDHALNLMQFVESELSNANEDQASNDAPVLLANNALKEIEDSLSELENVAEDLITNNPNKESEQRGQGIYQATKRLRFLIKNIRRGEGLRK
ncbi:hypothetical protein ACA544_18100 [Vibrio cholerae]|uniref:hypothetical protein n=1 Tax=Vibrio cholerae TaxID=666 RepID=UPI0011D6E910|nr:hypothetical protein [Vibrio cholerae]TXY78007.1 hypothetical protein FXE80_01225 [Vibrio cholerae]GIB16846.1 hypothetical protein VCSRO90_2831 [Vibrio cholerae]